MVTTKDLARECGVSLSTVQRALHGNGRINAETKRKILEKAKELNYQPDLIARTLVSGRSMSIGMIVPFLDNQYYPRLCNALAEAVAEEGYVLSILIHEDRKELEKKMITMLQGNHVDGIILNPINKGEQLLDILKNLRVNCCLLGIDEVKECPCPSIGNDEKAAGIAAAEHILKKGYQKLIFVVPTLYDEDGYYNFGHHRRLDGVRECLGKKELEPVVITGGDYAEKAKKIIAENSGEKPAILCSGEVFALRVLGALAMDGKQLGKDFGMMTFDYSKSFEALNVNMTALNNNVEKIGDMAGKLMVKMCNGEKIAEKTNVSFTIMEGDTL